jgi:HNH endonuclease
MKCIFCKLDSESSRSVEHVIPESLGNVEHTVRPGVVCDKCNNYFANRVEGPLLTDPYFRDHRFQAEIMSKKGNPPRVMGIHMPSRVEVELLRNPDGSGISAGAAYERDDKVWVESIRKATYGKLYLPKPSAPNESLMSRFLAKVALESLALRLADFEGGVEEVDQKQQLDAIRNYARRGGTNVWPFHTRTLYNPDFSFNGSGQGRYEVLHEWTLLYEPDDMLYLVIAIFGVEYAINMGEPEIDTYRNWMDRNAGLSALYPKGLNQEKQ